MIDQSDFVTDKDILTMAVTFTTSVIVAIFTSIITARLAFKRFYSEKQWERTSKAYSKLFIALHTIKDHTQHALIIERADESRVTPAVIDEREQAMKRLRKSMLRGQAELQLHLDIGTFLISRRAVSLLDEFLNKLDEGVEIGRETNANAYESYLVHRLKATESCLAMLRSEAQRDTGQAWK